MRADASRSPRKSWTRAARPLTSVLGGGVPALARKSRAPLSRISHFSRGKLGTAPSRPVLVGPSQRRIRPGRASGFQAHRIGFPFLGGIPSTRPTATATGRENSRGSRGSSLLFQAVQSDPPMTPARSKANLSAEVTAMGGLAVGRGGAGGPPAHFVRPILVSACRK